MENESEKNTEIERPARTRLTGCQLKKRVRRRKFYACADDPAVSSSIEKGSKRIARRGHCYRDPPPPPLFSPFSGSWEWAHARMSRTKRGQGASSMRGQDATRWGAQCAGPRHTHLCFFSFSEHFGFQFALDNKTDLAGWP